MRTLISCLLVVLATLPVRAQSLSPEVIASAGESFASGTVYLDWTLGELMVETVAGPVVLTQGFHQPLLRTTSIGSPGASFGAIQVYPNPTADWLTIETETVGALQVVLLDMAGRRILSQSLTGSVKGLDLSHLPQGIYLLRMLNDKQGSTSLLVEKR